MPPDPQQERRPYRNQFIGKQITERYYCENMQENNGRVKDGHAV